MKAYIAIPTYNAGERWKEVAKKIRDYSPSDTLVQVIDSSSTDDTADIAKQHSFIVEKIEPKNFNHGGTRNKLVAMHESEYDVVIFLTQDAIPEPLFYEKIIAAFQDEKVASAYGRQLPHVDANALSKHARYFNYKKNSYKSTIEDIPKMGLKAAFTSNSFCAYRIEAFNSLGGFPVNTILSEDMYFAAKSLIAGFKVAYVSDAKVKHSHNYSASEEFKRYFDIGVFQKNEQWIKDKFGGAAGEGIKFMLSEFNFLIRTNPLYIPKSIIQNFAKLSGYKIGKNYNKLPLKIVKSMSMHKRFWS